MSTLLSLNLSAQHTARDSDAAASPASRIYQVNHKGNSASEKSYIVQFEEAPALLQVLSGGKNASASLASVHHQFGEDLTRIASALGVHGRDVTIHDTYSSVFNGASITASPSAVHEIRRLPYVKRVHEDGVMLGAGRVATGNEGVFKGKEGENERTGNGVVIAVIDSGVDYLHPDLAGGYLGGYDYVNDDPDPMDDNGHGTHVAGIVAGNGATFKGTAPEVKYIALKVLDAAGRGFDSAVIRAIEHAVDPDGNPATPDGVDIINLSLSSLEIGMADHPVTIAVENAVEAGIVCVVAAGNRGEEGRASITAPGNATKAITVGAADAQGELAVFSSQGPSGSTTAYTSPFFGLKPDILAPGVQVESTWLRGAYEVMDGTSMASPYVAGLAARMMQEYPEWNPGMIKARLMQQTRDLGESIWAQGAGLAEGPDQINFVVAPACIDLGIVYNSQDNLKRSESLNISNVSLTAKTYDIQIRDGLPAGVQAISSASALTVEPGQSLSIELDIIVNPALLAVQAFPDGYVGFVDISDGTSTVSIPFSLFKPDLAHIKLNENADHIVLQRHSGEQSHVFVEASDLNSLFVTPDTYDLIAQFNNGQYTVIKEALALQEATLSVIEREESLHKVSLNAVDVNGEVLTPEFYEMTIKGRDSDWALTNQIDLSTFPEFPLYVSSVSDAFAIEFNVSAFSGEEDYYEIPFVVVNGLNESTILQNDAQALKRFHYQYVLPEGVDRAYFIPWRTQNASLVPLHYDDLSQFSHPGYALSPPFEKNVYTTAAQIESERSKGYGHSIVQPTQASQKLHHQHALIRTAPIVMRGGAAMLDMNTHLYPVSETEPGYTALYPGSGNGFWAGSLDNSSTKIRIQGLVDGGLFRGAMGEAYAGEGEWSIWKDSERIDSDTLRYQPDVVPGADPFVIERTVEPGAYTVFVRHSAFLKETGKKDHAVELYVQTNRADPDPPRINAMLGRLGQEEREELVLDITDVCNWCTPEDARDQVANVQLWVKRTEFDDWTEQPLAQHDSLFVGSFRGAYNSAYYALRVRAEDSFGNSMDYYSADESNFSVTDPKSVQARQEDAVPGRPSVDSAYPNPSVGLMQFSYALPTPSDVHISVYDMLGRNVIQVLEHQSAGTHQQVLDFSSLSNGLYFIKVQAGPYSDVQQVMKVE